MIIWKSVFIQVCYWTETGLSRAKLSCLIISHSSSQKSKKDMPLNLPQKLLDFLNILYIYVYLLNVIFYIIIIVVGNIYLFKLK